MRSWRLSDRDIRAGGERVVQRLDEHQIAAVIHDCDRRRSRAPPCFRDRRCDHLPRSVERQRFLLGKLRERAGLR